MISAKIFAIGTLILLTWFVALLVIHGARSFSTCGTRFYKSLTNMLDMVSRAFLFSVMATLIYLLVAFWVEVLK